MKKDDINKQDTPDKTLKKMTRVELLELLLEQSEQMDKMEKELKLAKTLLEKYQKQLRVAKVLLKKREIAISTSGSIAEAALKLNGVFEAAQKAADEYLENVRRNAENLE
jgi:hypothetical protein